ncbi:uncharacterized protein CTRU02_213551 [Colletotrichum truncatum]|uniref:Uncharacterized protein n=1 Tax=Colletotrichum truncatum TaxID=5467 RepID=A0ACC3YG06_COLTU|nr:uncharacterized protein CTRU02_12485 [Colletotrichum truncatum]KAF6784496.1 hypothetical protein CTRU02_12485 [Colletotrichum truncatum]
MASLNARGGWIVGSKKWYIIAMSNIPTKYGLSTNAKQLLQYLDDCKANYMDEAELGRKVRLSLENRKAITDTIRKVASLMQEKPKETQYCLQLIEMCTEILDIANRPPPPEGFPFLKLPKEIRARILSLIIDQYNPPSTLVPVEWGNCACVNPEKYAFAMVTEAQKKCFRLLGKSLGDEFYDVLYRHRTWYFACCCTLLSNLKSHAKLFHHLRNAHVHWCGPVSDQAFDLLAKCPNLRNLTIKISKATVTTLNAREGSLATYFALSYKNRRLMDSLGADELLSIRGIRKLRVQHLSSAQRVQLSEFDRQGLLSLLSAKLKQ